MADARFALDAWSRPRADLRDPVGHGRERVTTVLLSRRQVPADDSGRLA
ncbi:hypothetical protein [Halomonas nitroreducens]|nr:hypothetical protein [Halomonas nitroreducens]